MKSNKLHLECGKNCSFHQVILRNSSPIVYLCVQVCLESGHQKDGLPG